MAKANAKLIISGEHSVVYGAPALGMAVTHLHTEVMIEKNNKQEIACSLFNFHSNNSISISEIDKIADAIISRYSAFLDGTLNIKQVLQNEFDIVYYVVATFCHHAGISIKHGLDIKINSTIPISAGLGSSAALIISLLSELCVFFDYHMPGDDFFSLAHAAEKLQHGYTSGLDIKIILHGGMMFMHGAQIQMRNTRLPGNWFLVNSGKPQSSTGQAVTHAQRFLQHQGLVQEFADITKTLDQEIINGNLSKCVEAIKQNNLLLKAIGVVPEQTQRFICKIEQIGGAAKISGAGAIAGEHGGCLIVVGISENAVRHLCAEFGYTFIANISCK